MRFAEQGQRDMASNNKRGKWARASRRDRAHRHLRRNDDIAPFRAKAVERDLPPRPDLRDSRGRPISLPEVSILKKRPA